LQNNTFSGESPSQNIIVLDEIGSTNDYLKSELSNFKPFAEWTAIMARHQTAGKGQRGNTWLVPPNKNLTFSTFVLPKELLLSQHFFLNILVSLSICDWLENQGLQAEIKWPNDIYLNGKKICGILLENTAQGNNIRQSIIGIGINVNQEEFPEEIQQRASSILLETGKTTPSLEVACAQILVHLQKRFFNFSGQNDQLKRLLDEYNKQLYQRGIPAYYSSENKIFQGTIQKVDNEGQLYLTINEKEKVFQFKELKFLLQ